MLVLNNKRRVRGGKSNAGRVVLWTSGDKEVALKMVFMYTLNSRLKGWWDEIKLIIGGLRKAGD